MRSWLFFQSGAVGNGASSPLQTVLRLVYFDEYQPPEAQAAVPGLTDAAVAEVLAALKLGPKDVVWDLQANQGRAVLNAALHGCAKVVGVTSRVEYAKAALYRLRISG